MRDMAALTPAKKQAAYRARHKAAEQSRPDAIEAALFERAARCEELSDEQRAALADEIADIAKGCARTREASGEGPTARLASSRLPTVA